jgi:DNA adenine methylase
VSAYPIVPWIGGKRRLADRLIRLFPQHTCYVEVFAGAAAVFFAKTPSEVEVLNDVNGDLVNLYRVVQHHLEEFVRQFKWALTSREVFRWLQITPAETLTDIQRAARFYYLQVLCFSGKVTGQNFGTATTAPPGLNLLRIEEDLSAAHLRLASVYIERLDWAACMDKYDRSHTFFYLDPPYWETEGYGVPFPLDQYAAIAARLRTIKGRAIVSLGDHPAMREAFAGLPVEEVDITYTVNSKSGQGAERRELVVFNWDPKEGSGGLFA